MSMCGTCAERPRQRIAVGIIEAADALGVSPYNLAVIVSYETKGTFDPLIRGEITQHGRHRGLIQFGEEQARRNGVDWDNPIDSQVGASGAIVNYMRGAGVKPGHGLLDLYAAVNAGHVGLYDRTDENNGGTRGTVRDKVNRMEVQEGHGPNAERFMKLAEGCSCLERTSSDSSVIYGDQKMSDCLRKAGLWSIRAYHNPPENVAEAIRDDYMKLDEEWDILWDMGTAASGASPEAKQAIAAETATNNPGVGGETITDPDVAAAASGFYALLSQPKGEYSATSPTCPPVLSLRGSEFQSDEFRGLAIGFRLTVEKVFRTRDGTGALNGGRSLSRLSVNWPMHIGHGWEADVADAGPPVVDEQSGWEWLADKMTIRPEIESAIDTLLEATEYDVLPDGEIDDHLSRTIAALDLPHLQNVLDTDMLFDRTPPRTGLMRRVESLMGGEFWTRYRGVVSLHYSEDGDWAVNVAQALGKFPEQYQQAAAAVDRAIPAARARGNRLNITGHSLGGGLASAAAVYCHRTYPDIKLGCQIFNASGLHENNAARLGGGRRDDGLVIPVYTKQVAGELLTMAQTPGGFPLVWDIFRWEKNVKIPDAIGLTDMKRAISPGPFPVGPNQDPNARGPKYVPYRTAGVDLQHFRPQSEPTAKHDFLTPLPPYPNTGYAEKDVRDGAELPNIFPLHTQNRFASPTYTLEEMTLTPTGNAGNPGTGNMLGGTAPSVLREQSVLDESSNVGQQPEVNGNTMTQRRPATSTPLEFPHIDAISGIANNAASFTEFIKNTATYLATEVAEDVAEQFPDDEEERSTLSKLNPASNTIEYFRTIKRVISGVSQTAGELKTEISRTGELFALAAAYHPMDIGGSTFLRPPDDEK